MVQVPQENYFWNLGTHWFKYCFFFPSRLSDRIRRLSYLTWKSKLLELYSLIGTDLNPRNDLIMAITIKTVKLWFLTNRFHLCLILGILHCKNIYRTLLVHQELTIRVLRGVWNPPTTTWQRTHSSHSTTECL